MRVILVLFIVYGGFMMHVNGISVFEFLEYSQYLKALYDENKRIEPAFSYRKMAREMGFTSPNYCKLLIDGERHLARRSFEQVFKALQLTRREQEYFGYLVEFARAKEPREKNYYFEKIATFRGERSITEIKPEQFDYLIHWYNVAIRELLSHRPDLSAPREIQKCFRPTVTTEQILHSIDLLTQLGMLEETEEGYKTTAKLLNTDGDIGSMAIRGFHRQMVGLAEESLDSVPVSKREFSSVTLSLSEKGYQKMCERIRQFREEALHIACDDRGVDRVMQLNMHLFPLTKESK